MIKEDSLIGFFEPYSEFGGHALVVFSAKQIFEYRRQLIYEETRGKADLDSLDFSKTVKDFMIINAAFFLDELTDQQIVKMVREGKYG